MSFYEVIDLIEQEKANFIILLCHQNADPDAICSAFALSQLLKRLKPDLKVEIASPEGISKLSKLILEALPIEVETEVSIEKADIIITLDTNTIQQLGNWSQQVKASSAPLIVIDHHTSHPETEKLATLCVCNETASSTCEIVFGFYRELKLMPSETVAKALFLGIAFDTKHFILANSNTFMAVSELVNAGFNAKEALSILSLPMDFSERIARLKASQRVKLLRIDCWIIAFSHVRSYQASAARALIELGAHIAIVSGQRDDELQISLRASQDFYKKTNFHLGRDLARPLGEYLHGMGGGHSTSAGVNGIGDFETVVKRSIRLLKAKLGK